jgi:hypothetical protein
LQFRNADEEALVRLVIDQLVYRAPRPRVGNGWYYLQVRIDSPGFSQYTLSFTKR